MTISLSRETIRLMLQSQRIIKHEFGVRIELDDDQVMARVFAYAAQSNSDVLKQCASELMQTLIPGQSDTGHQHADAMTSATRIYRGQLVAVEKPGQAKHEEQQDDKNRTGKHVIYRGRRVSQV